MIRTRYVAAAAAIAVAGSSLALAAPASAAPSTLTFTGSTLYTGASPVITVDLDNSETGPFELNLMQGDTEVATISSNTDVAGLAAVKWTIPTTSTKLVGEGFTLELVSTATEDPFDPIVSSEFAIAKSTISGVAYQDDAPEPEDEEEEQGDPIAVATAEAGSTHDLVWTKLGATGGKVKVDLVQTISGKEKRTTIVKETANDGSEEVTLPLKAVANAVNRLEVTPVNKAATAGKSADFAITAPGAGTVKVVAAGGTDEDTALGTAKNGDTVTVTWTNESPVQLDLYLDGATKPAAKIAKSVTGGTYDFVIPAKLAAGTYSVKATVVGVKPAVSADSTDIVIAQPTITATDLEAPAQVSQGETVTIAWTTNGAATSTGSVTVSLVNGEKVTKLDSKAVTTNGAGSIEWVVPAKQAAGETYSFRVSNNNVKQADGTYDDTAAFTIYANTTVVN